MIVVATVDEEERGNGAEMLKTKVKTPLGIRQTHKKTMVEKGRVFQFNRLFVIVESPLLVGGGRSIRQ